MTKKRFTLEMQYWKGNPQGRQLFDNVTGEENMSVEDLCGIASGLHCKCEELESVLEVTEEVNEQLELQNRELKEDNDIKFWKLQCIQSSNNNQIMLFELSRAIQQGYEVSDKFKQHLDEIKAHDKEIREKHKRLFE